MTRKEITDLLSKYEQDYNVQKYIVDQVNIWPLVRVLLASHIEISFLSFTPVKFRKIKEVSRILYKILSYIKLKFFDRRHNATLKECDICILAQSDDRRITISKKGAYNVFSDPFIDEFKNYDFITSEIYYSTISGRRYNPSHEVFLPFISYLSYPLNRYKIELPESLIDDLESFCSDNNFPVLDIKRIKYHLKVIFSMKDYYYNLFTKIKPKLLILTRWMMPVRMGACLAAKELGIDSVELQHGLQSDDHYHYAGWAEKSNEGYALVPDYFWVWGEDNRQNLIDNSPGLVKSENIIVGGNPLINQIIDGNLSSLLSNNDDAVSLIGDYENSILVTLQNADDSEVDFISNLIHNSPVNWLWLIRLHPSLFTSKKSIKTHLNASNIDLNIANGLPLVQLFKVVDSHLTPCSTCALEALPFGIKTILFQQNGSLTFQKYIEKNMMYYSEDINEITTIIAHQRKVSIDTSSIFADSSYTKNALDRLMSICE